MLSFNHYAYGAVIDWVYRNVAGLAPDATPGLPPRDIRTASGVASTTHPHRSIQRDRVDRVAPRRGPAHRRHRATDRNHRHLRPTSHIDVERGARR